MSKKVLDQACVYLYRGVMGLKFFDHIEREYLLKNILNNNRKNTNNPKKLELKIGSWNVEGLCHDKFTQGAINITLSKNNI